MEESEVDVKSIRAHDFGCIGCQTHKKDIMISYNGKDSEDDIIDLFLTQEQAEEFHKELGIRLKYNNSI